MKIATLFTILIRDSHPKATTIYKTKTFMAFSLEEVKNHLDTWEIFVSVVDVPVCA